MRTLFTATIAIILFATLAPAVKAQSAADEAAVRKAEEQNIAAYNAGDAKAFCATYVEDVENWSGTLKGRAACEKNFGERFSGTYSQIKLLEEIGIVFVTPDVAIYKARYELSGSTDEAGETSPPSKGLSATVYVKKDGKWLGAHIYFYRTIEE